VDGDNDPDVLITGLNTYRQKLTRIYRNITCTGPIDITTSTTGITIEANNTTPGVTYQWLNCDSNNLPIPGETNQTFTATLNGNYAVAITEGGCVDTSACVAITTVGIVESTFDHLIKVFPNPSTGAFTIDLGSVYESTHITIRDLMGKVVSSSNHSSTSSIQLTIDDPIGIYFIEIVSGDNRAQLKLIKQ
jgi:hypothetical protein